MERKPACRPLRRRLAALAAMGALAALLGGCVVYPGHPYWHGYWHDDDHGDRH